jgi:DMSO reductase anchor subunit/ferredoxin
VQQTVTAACHHCLDPACLSGCPVNAYVKDDVTGIVKHLDDQCIGCQYCTLTCPYEVPQFNARLGIVRKCDMCGDRLAEGEAPACVRGCPNEAIAIRIVETQATIDDAQTGALVPGAPASGITFPTTGYRTERAFPRNMLPADFFAVHPAHEHRPLVIMLVLTQLSVGAFCVDQLFRPSLPIAIQQWFRPFQAAVALLLGLVALGASTMHLGRPQYAFRALLGLKTSWLSREILAFGAFSACAALHAGGLWLSNMHCGPRWTILTSILGNLGEWPGVLVSVSGLIGVYCSVMVYARTRRFFWSAARTAFKFFLTVAVLGVATNLWVMSVGALFRAGPEAQIVDAVERLSGALLGFVVLKLAGEATLFLHLRDRQFGDLARSALLLQRELARWSIARFVTGLIGALVVPLVLLGVEGRAHPELALAIGASIALLLLVAGELLERATFFLAVASLRMPGGLP